jgi:hypothetical protein
MQKLATITFAGAILAAGFAASTVPASADEYRYRCEYGACGGDRHDHGDYRRFDRGRFENFSYNVRPYFAPNRERAQASSCWQWSRYYQRSIWVCGQQ